MGASLYQTASGRRTFYRRCDGMRYSQRAGASDSGAGRPRLGRPPTQPLRGIFGMRHYKMFWGWLLLAALGAGAAAGQTEGNIANVEFRLDERVFTVMCALHAAGYDWGKDKEPPDGAAPASSANWRRRPSRPPSGVAARLLPRPQRGGWTPSPGGPKYTAFALLLGRPPSSPCATAGDCPPRPCPTWPVRNPAAPVSQGGADPRPVAQMAGAAAPGAAGHARRHEGLHPRPSPTARTGPALPQPPAGADPDTVNAPGILNAVHTDGTYYIIASPAR